MKKIDLHIHTVATNKDSAFDFSVDEFKNYVTTLSLDAVAVTNHNIFDKENFEEILANLEIPVFPGIEIDLENGHLLLISENDNLDDFQRKCDLVTSEINQGNKITSSKLTEIFGDLNDYLLIPHYEKDPIIGQSTIQALSSFITAGEVSSPKKFNRIHKKQEALVPVYFSDSRIEKNLDISKYQGKQTFIKNNTEILTLGSIKDSLADRNKVFLTKNEKHGFFQVFNDGQELSNGLNVILGERSSGKTHFLNKLKSIYDSEDKTVKYIEQFDLVKEDDKTFTKNIEKERSRTREEFLDEFKDVVDDVIIIERIETEQNITDFIESLVDFALTEQEHDEYSIAVLYRETKFSTRDEDDLEELLSAVKKVQENQVQKDIINKYLPEDKILELFTELTDIFKEKVVKNLKKDWVNDLVENIQTGLESQTSSPAIKNNDLDLYVIKMEEHKIRKFNTIASALKKNNVISENTSFGKFKIQATSSAYSSVAELHDESGRQISFRETYAHYATPIDFLESLKNITALPKSELYRYFCKVTYHVLNQYDKGVSGGERAEFNLLKSLQDARQFEMLLIDEPESSFDNLFLKDSVNQLIKDISKEMPVIVVTHNNTVGMLLKPEFIVYTKRDIVGDKDSYKIYSGSPGDKKFKTTSGEEIGSYDVLMKALEAGEEAYKQRESLYQNYK